jgi:hypothetical protein
MKVFGCHAPGTKPERSGCSFPVVFGLILSTLLMNEAVEARKGGVGGDPFPLLAAQKKP